MASCRPIPIPQDAPPPIERRLLRDEVYGRLRDAIVDGTLAPGEQLKDAELAQSLGVSRTPIREALLRLAEAGLVTMRPGRSTTVSSLDARTVRDARDVVAAMHRVAVREAVAGLTEADLEAMREAGRRFEAAVGAGDLDAALRADDELPAVAANRALSAVLEQFMPVLRQAERLRCSASEGRASVRRHEDLIRLCAAGDAEGRPPSRSTRSIVFRWSRRERRESRTMFASMRRYRLQAEQADEFVRRVDETFADRIAAQPGFVSYVLIDCGEGDIFTLSLFAEPGQAEASRELAQRWTQEQLTDIAHTRFEAIHGESAVSRAAPGMLDPVRHGSARKSVSIRLYHLRHGSVSELLRTVDRAFADQLQQMEGFEASHVLDCENGEVLWVTVLRDDQTADVSEERAIEFVRDELTEYRLEREIAIRGELAVSRASAGLLEPAHA